MKLLNFKIITLTLYLIIGILTGHFIEGAFNELSLITAALLIIYIIGIYFTKQQFQQPIWTGLMLLITMSSIGALSLKLHEQYRFKNHYTNHIDIDSIVTIQLRIKKTLKSGHYNDKYEIDILKADDVSVSGKSLLNISRNDSIHSLKVDDILILKTQFKDLKAPLNPSQFNYKDYLNKKHIYHQLFTTQNSFFKLDSTKHTLFGYAASIREKININLNRFQFNLDEIAIINALLLGQRQDVSKEIYNSYVHAGVIHILAVSGLHIGIILMLLDYLLKPLEYIKYGKFIKAILLVLILWSFAIVAGLSASVVRAVTMFTAVAIAMNLRRPTNIFNTLAISMFILLLCKPTFLFDVGFQLSYLAVFAIVVIQPMLYNLYQPRFKLDNLFWNIFTVTLAAQLGVIPISLYYFHQFPGLFFISNLVIIPFLGLILGFGILIIILALINLLPQVLASFYGKIISSMNSFVHWISQQEDFLFQNISFNSIQVLFSYLFIATSIILIKNKTYKNIISILIIVLIFQGYLIFDSHNSTNNTLIIFHKSRFSILGISQNNQLKLYHNLPEIASEKLITNYRVGHNIDIIEPNTLRNVYVFNEKKLLMVDSLGIYIVKTFNADFVLLRNSPKINLARLIDSLSPEIIISDGSNFKSYQERWAKTCDTKKIPFHQTDAKGAFIYTY